MRPIFPLVQDPVLGHLDDPGFSGSFVGIESFRLLIEMKEDGLRQFFGLSVVAHNTMTDLQDQFGIPCKEKRQGIFCPVPGGAPALLHRSRMRIPRQLAPERSLRLPVSKGQAW